MSEKVYERVRYVVLVNRARGKVAVVDQFKVRLAKMRKRIFAWASVVETYKEVRGARTIMVTLTYKNKDDYQAGHIGSYLAKLKGILDKRLIAWAWVAELQKRGAMHYHLLLVVPEGTLIEKPDESGQWQWGMSKVEIARTPYYLAKYSGKGEQKDLSKFPRGARLYGISVRGLPDELKRFYRLLSGLAFESDGELADWEFVGAAVTDGYARYVLGERANSMIK